MLLQKIIRSRGKKWLTAQGRRKSFSWNQIDSGRVFFAFICTKNKLMKSFKFTGISICCFTSHRLADNSTCGEVQHFVLEHLRGSGQTESRLTLISRPRVKKIRLPMRNKTLL